MSELITQSEAKQSNVSTLTKLWNCNFLGSVDAIDSLDRRSFGHQHAILWTSLWWWWVTSESVLKRMSKQPDIMGHNYVFLCHVNLDIASSESGSASGKPNGKTVLSIASLSTLCVTESHSFWGLSAPASTHSPQRPPHIFATMDSSILTLLRLSLFVVLLHLVAGAIFVHPDDYPQDTIALHEFFNATNGTRWTINTNWTQPVSICTWYGVTCDCDPNQSGPCQRVYKLTMQINNLVGTFPPSFKSLDFLGRLDLYSNSMFGPLPDVRVCFVCSQYIRIIIDFFSPCLLSCAVFDDDISWIDLHWSVFQ
jgi:hypothetical protein